MTRPLAPGALRVGAGRGEVRGDLLRVVDWIVRPDESQEGLGLDVLDPIPNVSRRLTGARHVRRKVAGVRRHDMRGTAQYCCCPDWHIFLVTKGRPRVNGGVPEGHQFQPRDQKSQHRVCRTRHRPPLRVVHALACGPVPRQAVVQLTEDPLRPEPLEAPGVDSADQFAPRTPPPERAGVEYRARSNYDRQGKAAVSSASGSGPVGSGVSAMRPSSLATRSTSRRGIRTWPPSVRYASCR